MPPRPRPIGLPKGIGPEAWAKQRAWWKLANRGDTHYAADRRLYKLQMEDLRKAWQVEALQARRDAYVAERAAAAAADDGGARAAKLAAAKERKAAHRSAVAEALAIEREQLEKQKANKRRVMDARLATREAAETAYRKRWLADVLAEYDVSGGAAVPGESAAARERERRSWLTRENFETKLGRILTRLDSPVDDWLGIAKKTHAAEEREAIGEKLGGRLQLPPSNLAQRLLAGAPARGAGGDGAEAGVGGGGSGAAGAAALPVSALHDRAAIGAAVGAELGEQDAEHAARLTELIANLNVGERKAGLAAQASFDEAQEKGGEPEKEGAEDAKKQ